MSNNIRKSSIEQAKSDFDEIRKFAQDQAELKLQEEIDKKILEIINEDVNISIDSEGNIDITKDGEEIISVNPEEESNEEETSEEDFIEVSDDEEPIEVSSEEDEYEDEFKNENMLEMDEAEIPANDQNTPAAPAPVAPATEISATDELSPETEEIAPEAEESEIDGLISKMDTLINVLMQQNGMSAEQGNDQEFEVIDDESSAEAPATPEGDVPAPAPAAPTTAPENELQEEDELQFEISDFEEGEDDLLEFIDEEIFEEEEGLTIVDEDDSLDETRGLGFTSKRTGDKTLKLSTMADENGHHSPVTALRESKIKAQYESKLDELIKENKGLNYNLKELRLERKEFEDAFIQLREQFDEMQTFNGKLALVNKLLMNGGLSFDQKINVCEQFDNAENIEDAQKIYKNIIKENNIKVNDASSKIKATNTNVAKSTATETKPLYESAEAKRMKQLAGMTNNSEN